MGKEEILLSLYQDYREHARHSESIRETVNTLLLAVAAGIFTVMAQNSNRSGQMIGHEDKYLAITLLGVGIIGLFSFLSYTDRYYRNKTRAYHILEKLLSPEIVQELKEESDEKHNNENRKHLGSNIIKAFQFKKQNWEKPLHHIISLIVQLLVIGISILLIIDAL